MDAFLVQAPQQARSRDTMHRILDATTALLEEQTFDQLTVAEIVARAGCSVGAFYGRFRDKEALLHALDERFLADFVAEAETILAPDRWDAAPISAIAEALIAFLVEAYGTHRGLLRALMLHARLSSGSGGTGEAQFRARERRAWRLLPDFEALMLSRRDQIAHPDPALAIRLGFLQAFYALREILLWEDVQSKPDVSPETLVQELTQSYLAYLGFVRV
jgi:AcrR family transcriptional regulator